MGLGANAIAQDNGRSKGSVSKVATRLEHGPTERKAGPCQETQYTGAEIKEIEHSPPQNTQQSTSEVAAAAAV